MLSLNDLRSTAVGLDWHEAVAVGAALATLIAEAQAPACPRPADVALLPTGELRVTGPGHVEGSSAAGVADVLASSSRPRRIRRSCGSWSRRTPATAHRARRSSAVTGLVSELAFFERPGRRDVLSAVALRAEPAMERASRAAALEALTERTRLAAPPPRRRWRPRPPMAKSTPRKNPATGIRGPLADPAG